MVQEYLDNNNILQKNGSITLQNITDSYIADMSKYTNNNYESVKIERVYKNIPSQLAKENKKYQISKLEKNARLRDYMSSIDWLLASKLIIPCYYVNKFETPLKAYQDDTNFKIYLSDAGLLTESLYIPYSKIILDEDFMFKGAISENYVACELIKKNINLYYYYESQVIEIDFLIDTKDGVIPIQVKAGNHTASKSLNKYMEAYKPKYAIRISSKNFGFENNIKSVPLYAVFCIDK